MRFGILLPAGAAWIIVAIAVVIGMADTSHACIRDGGATRSVALTRGLGLPTSPGRKAAPATIAIIPAADRAVERLRITLGLPEDGRAARGASAKVWLRLPADLDVDCGSPRRQLIGEVSFGAEADPSVLEVRISDLPENARSAVLTGRASLKIEAGRTLGNTAIRVLAVEYVTAEP